MLQALVVTAVSIMVVRINIRLRRKAKKLENEIDIFE